VAGGVQFQLNGVTKNVLFYGSGVMRVSAHRGETHTRQPSLTWDNARRTLRIGMREGRFPGMTAQRMLRNRLMAAAPGGRIQEKTVRYDGASVDVRFNR
jgi:hypothetical protein